MRCDFFAQFKPVHQRIHGVEEFITLLGFAELFKVRLCVDHHDESLLLYGNVICPDAVPSGDF